jgi:hypothetical protein
MIPVSLTFINSFICFFSMRDCSSRCSFAVSLHAVSFASLKGSIQSCIRVHDIRKRLGGVCVGDYGLLFTQSEIWYDVGWLSGCCADEPLPKNVGAS